MDVRLNNVYQKLVNLQSFDYRALDNDLANCVYLIDEGKNLKKLLANKSSVTELLSRIHTRFNQLNISSDNFDLLEKRITDYYKSGE